MWLHRSLKVVIIKSYLFLTRLELLLKVVNCLWFLLWSNIEYPPSATSANPDWCNVCNSNYVEGRWHCSSSTSWHLSCSIAPLTNHILPQMPGFDQLFQVILECSALLGNMPLFSMISAVQILFPSNWIFSHFIKLAEIKLMLNLLQDFMHRLFESNVHSFPFANGVLSPSLPSGPLLKVPNLGFLLVLKLTLFCSLSSSSLLCSSIRLINWCMFLEGCMVKESLSSKWMGSPNLKVFATTCSLSPPILLYNSQYLFK